MEGNEVIHALPSPAKVLEHASGNHDVGLVPKIVVRNTVHRFSGNEEV